MKLVIACLIILVASCTTIDKGLRNAISFGEITELNKYSKDVDKQLFVRMLSAPIFEEKCFLETQGVCRYQYFISVSTFDEYPETNIFRLKATGEVKEVNWLESLNTDTVEIELVIENFSKEALENNPNLVSQPKHIKVILTPQSIEELPVLGS